MEIAYKLLEAEAFRTSIGVYSLSKAGDYALTLN
jgi:hypothetical protein